MPKSFLSWRYLHLLRLRQTAKLSQNQQLQRREKPQQSLNPNHKPKPLPRLTQRQGEWKNPPKLSPLKMVQILSRHSKRCRIFAAAEYDSPAFNRTRYAYNPITAALIYSVRKDIQFFYGFGIFKPGRASPDFNSDGTDGRALRAAALLRDYRELSGR